MLHSSISILVTFLWLSHPPIPKLLAVFGGLTVVIGTADLLRFNNQAFERTYENALGFFMASRRALASSHEINQANLCVLPSRESLSAASLIPSSIV